MHTVGDRMCFGLDRFSSRKHYFQCLIAAEQLRLRGLLALPSGESAWYYRAVLASEVPASVPRGLRVDGYRALMAGCGQDAICIERDGPTVGFLQDDSSSDESTASSDAVIAHGLPTSSDSVFLPGPEDSTPLPPSLPGAMSGGQGGEAPASATGSLGQVAVASSSASSSSGTDADVAGQSVAALVAGGGQVGAHDDPRPPAHDCIKVEEHLRPGMPGHYRRYTTVCPLARSGHCGVVPCGKRRNCGQAQMGRLGPAAPEAFLMVWRAAASSFVDKSAHQRWSPTEAEVRRYMVQEGWL